MLRPYNGCRLAIAAYQQYHFILMESRDNHVPVNGVVANGSPLLELHLGREVFATGNRLSGVVLLRLNKAINIRSLSVSVTGIERPAGASFVRAFKRNGAFFEREQLLSGALKPRLVSDRASLLWNAILQRNMGRTLSAGEHTYPFSITLPASLPGSYEGRAGRIDYRVTARLQPVLGRAIRAWGVVPVVFVPRMHRGRPVALSSSAPDDEAQSTDTNMTIELPEHAIAMGGKVEGRFAIANPRGLEIPRVTASLEVCEWVRLAVDKEIERHRVDEAVIKPEDPTASSVEAEFSLRLPDNAPPSIDGTAISVIWLLKLTLDTTPPTEFKTPITVYQPIGSSDVV